MNFFAMRKLTKRHFFKKKLQTLYRFGILSHKFLVLWLKILGRNVKAAFYCKEDQFEEKKIWEKFWIFVIFWLWVKNFWRTIFGRLVKIALYIIKETFWGKLVFWRLFMSFIFFGPWSKSFLPSTAKTKMTALSKSAFDVSSGSF